MTRRSLLAMIPVPFMGRKPNPPAAIDVVIRREIDMNNQYRWLVYRAPQPGEQVVIDVVADVNEALTRARRILLMDLT